MADQFDIGNKYQLGTVQSGKMPSPETNATFFIDLSSLSKTGADIFDTCAADGGDIRVTTGDGATQLARDVIRIDKTAKTGLIIIKAPSLETGSTVRVYYNGTATEPAADSTYGSQAAWDSTYDAAYIKHADGYLRDETSNARHMYALNGRYYTHVYDSVSNVGPTAHQGCAYDGSYYYFIDTNYIYKRSTIDGSNIATNSNPAPSANANCNHLGASEVYGDYLYVPVERWVSCYDFTYQYIARYNKSDLTFYDAYSVSAQGHEVSALTIDPTAGTNGIIYVVSFCDGSKIWKYDLSDFSYLGSITISTTITAIQGICLDPESDGFIISKEGAPLVRVKLDGTYLGSAGLLTGGLPEIPESVFTYDGDLYWWDGNAYEYKLYKYKNISKVTAPIGGTGVLYHGDGLSGYASLTRTLPDAGSIQYFIQPNRYYDYNSVFDNSGDANKWECWMYSDGRAAARIGTSRIYDLDNLHTPNSHTYSYHCYFSWTKSGTSVNTALVVDGSSRANGSETWAAPGTTFYLNGGNASNNKGESYYWFVALRNIDIAADTDRLTSEYNNQFSPTTFWSFGDEQIIQGFLPIYRKKTNTLLRR